MCFGVIALVTSKFNVQDLEITSLLIRTENKVISGVPAVMTYIFILVVGFTLIFAEVLTYVTLLIQNFKLAIVDSKDRLSAIIAIVGVAISLIAIFK